MRLIQITEGKVGAMSECLKTMLHYGGRLMSCLEEIEGVSYGERDDMGRYGNRDVAAGYGTRNDMGRYGNRDPYMGYREPYMGYRDDDSLDVDPNMMHFGQRGRRRDSMGRFI